jgi:hypothetical protein
MLRLLRLAMLESVAIAANVTTVGVYANTDPLGIVSAFLLRDFLKSK